MFPTRRPYRIGSSGGGNNGDGTGSPLTIVDRRAKTADGSNWFGVGVSAFSTFQHWIIDNAKARAFVAWAVSRRVQWLRAFCMYNGGIGRFIPSEHLDYFTQLRDFVMFCGDNGLRVQPVVYADCQNAPLRFDPHFWDLLCDAMAGLWNPLPSGGNEQPFNGFDPLQLRKPTGLVVGRCSMGTDAPVFEPTWDYASYETARDDQFERKYKGAADEYARGIMASIFIDEMIGIGEENESGRTTNDAFKCWQLTAGSKIVGTMGICGHIRSGIKGDVPGPKAEACIDAMVEAGSLPLGAHAFGHYVRGQSPVESPDPNLPIHHEDREAWIDPSVPVNYPGSSKGSLRTHAYMDGGEAHVIAPGPGPDYVGIAQNGWRIVQAFSYGDKSANVFICQK